MADVLRGMEDAEGQPSQEVTRGQEAGHGAEPEACARCSGEREEEEVRRCNISTAKGVSSVASYTAGSATRPPAAGCCPACSRSTSPAGGRPGCVRGRRGSGRGSSAR